MEKKTAPTRDRRRRFFTVMVVPHTEKAVLSFRIPTYAVEAFFALVGAAVIAALLFTNSYQKLTAQVQELQHLRQLTQEQRGQLENLTREAEAVRESLRRVEELEQQVRRMIQTDGSDSGQARVATLQPADPRTRRAAPDLPPGEEPLGPPALGGPPGPALPSATLAGLYATPAGTPPQALPDGKAQAVRADLQEAQAAGRNLLESLDQLRKAYAEQQAFLRSKPSGLPASGEITSHFGSRTNPYGWGTEFHPGLDVAAPHGAPVWATADGVVKFAGWDGAYGLKVEIDHGHGFSTVYGHSSRLLVEVGDRVQRGQTIGLTGSTGRSTGPHVHYEVRVYGRLADPLNYID